jgi:uncharacterized protein
MTPTIPAKEPVRVPWRHVAGFVALAYGISWTTWASAMPDAWHALQAGRTPATYTVAGLGMLGMFGPALAALLMRRFITHEPVRGSLGARRNWRHYAVAVLAPMLIVIASIAISAATGLADFRSGDKPLWALALVLLLINTPLSTIATLGEEYGWRGYLLPKLLPLGQIKASVLVALVWAPWHLPMLLVGLNYGGKEVFAVLAFMLALTVGLSLLLTRLFVVAAGSVLVTAVAHASFNAFGDRLSTSEHLTSNPFLGGVGGLVGLGVMALVGLAVYARGRSRPHRRSRAVGGEAVSARMPA